MNRLFPAPLLSVSLFGLWLLLNLSVSPGNLLLGAALGVLAPLLMAPLRPQHAHVRRPLVIARLIAGSASM
jgi:multicomponent K+:H+ antiporter subunit E